MTGHSRGRFGGGSSESLINVTAGARFQNGTLPAMGPVMFMTRTFGLVVLALPVMALLVACSEDAAPPETPSVQDTPVTTGGGSKLPPPSSMKTTSDSTTPAPEPKEEPAATDAGAATTTPKTDAAAPAAPGIDPDDCATQQGQECLACCVRTGGGNTTLPQCIQNCAQ